MLVSSFIHKSKKLTISHVSSNSWMVKQIVLYLYHRILSSNEKKWTIETYNNLKEFAENYADFKNPTPKGLYYMITFV